MWRCELSFDRSLVGVSADQLGQCVTAPDTWSSGSSSRGQRLRNLTPPAQP